MKMTAWPLWLLGTLVLLGFSFSCSEKAADPAPTASTGTKDGDGDDDGKDDDGDGDGDEGSGDEGSGDEGSGDDDDGGGSATFDLCDALDKASALPSSLVEDACGSGKHSLETLRGAYFKGSGNKITSESTEDAQITKMRISSSMLLKDVKVTDYYVLQQMKLFKPSDFKSAGFDVHPDTTYTKEEGDVGDKTVSYEFENTEHSPNGIIHYFATSTFTVLKKDQAYVVSTKTDTSRTKTDGEGVEDFTGMLIMVKKGSDTEVFTMSAQDLVNGGDHAATKSRADGSAKDEQSRSYGNGLKAADAEI